MGRRPGRKSGTKEKTIKYFDYTLLFVIIFLVCFGLVMLYSTSSYNAQIEYGDGTHYLKRQAFACCLGFAAMFVISKIDYHVWKRLYGVAYIGAFLLCVSVIFLGSNGNGSTRWFRLGPLSFQPSEFAKLAVIIFLATVISRMQKKIGDLKELMKVMVLLLPLVGPVAYTNLSTAIIIVGIAVAMAFVASPKYAQFVEWQPQYSLSEQSLLYWQAIVQNVSKSGSIRRIMIKVIRPCRAYMPLVLEDFLEKDLVPVCRSLGSYRKHRMIWYFPSSVRSLDYSEQSA